MAERRATSDWTARMRETPNLAREHGLRRGEKHRSRKRNNFEWERKGVLRFEIPPLGHNRQRLAVPGMPER